MQKEDTGEYLQKMFEKKMEKKKSELQLEKIETQANNELKRSSKQLQTNIFPSSKLQFAMQTP